MHERARKHAFRTICDRCRSGEPPRPRCETRTGGLGRTGCFPAARPRAPPGGPTPSCEERSMKKGGGMRLLVHVALGFGLVVASAGVASAKKCTDNAAVAAARAAADTECGGCASASNHGRYVSCVAHAAKDLVDSGDLPKECKGEVTSCAARSTCGKPGAVTCCRVDKRGKVKCSTKRSADQCKPPKGGQACVGAASSCCDSCGAGSPDGSFSCGGTTTTAAPTTTTAAPTTSTSAAPTTTTAAPTTSTSAAPTTSTSAAPTTTTTSSTTT